VAVSDIYRPLFVMVEAIEAEAKRLLEPKAAPRKPPLSEKMRVINREFRKRHKDLSLSFEPQTMGNGWVLQHRCTVCARMHRIVVDELSLLRADGPAGLVDLMLEKVDELYALPCVLELGHG